MPPVIRWDPSRGFPDILQIRVCGVCFYALRQGDEITLIDTGLLGASQALGRSLREAGWDRCRIVGILLSHGHLDHVRNAFRFAREFGAWVAAPDGEQDHVAGVFQYSGRARVCGLLEAVGRKLFGFDPPEVSEWFGVGREFDLLGGLVVVGLPGHTAGHCGFYLPERKLLFCGDLFASYGFSVHLPPAILSTRPEQIRESVDLALDLELVGLLPAHCDRSSPAVHLRRLRKLAAGSD